MRATKYVGECDENERPGVFTADRDSHLFQGDAVTDHSMSGPAGERIVEDRAPEFIAYREKALSLARPFSEWWAEYGTG